MKNKSIQKDIIIHYVPSGKYVNPSSGIEYPVINAHTHGLNKFGLKELAICFPLRMERAGRLLNGFAQSARDGLFDVNQEGIHDDILADGYVAELVSSYQFGEEFMFVVFPDEMNNLPSSEECSEPYSLQYDFIKYIENQELDFDELEAEELS